MNDSCHLKFALNITMTENVLIKAKIVKRRMFFEQSYLILISFFSNTNWYV